MEENKDPNLNSNPITVAPDVQTPLNSNQNSNIQKKKSHKLLILVLVIIGIIGLTVILINPLFKILNINPEQKFAEATLKACKEECASSKDTECTNKCLAAEDLREYITPVKISSTPTPTPTVSPTPTLSPTPMITRKVTSVPKSTPTPAGEPTLVVRVSKGVSTVTLHNQTTGKIITESISTPGKNYYVDPGAYRITFNEVPNCRAGHSLCYQSCSLTGGYWGQDDWGAMVNVNVETGKTNAVSLYYADPSKPVEICKTL